RAPRRRLSAGRPRPSAAASAERAASSRGTVRSLPAKMGRAARPAKAGLPAMTRLNTGLDQQPHSIIPSARHQPAIDIIGLAGDVAGAGGGQEHRHCGYVVRSVGAADRDARLLLGQQLLDRDAALGGAGDGVTRAKLRPGDAGTDRVDGDVVAAELL